MSLSLSVCPSARLCLSVYLILVTMYVRFCCVYRPICLRTCISSLRLNYWRSLCYWSPFVLRRSVYSDISSYNPSIDHTFARSCYAQFLRILCFFINIIISSLSLSFLALTVPSVPLSLSHYHYLHYQHHYPFSIIIIIRALQYYSSIIIILFFRYRYHHQSSALP